MTGWLARCGVAFSPAHIARTCLFFLLCVCSTAVFCHPVLRDFARAFGFFYLDLHTPVGVGESRVMALPTMTASLSEGRVRSEAAAFNSLATGREQAAGVGVYGSHTTAAVPVQTGL